MKRTAIMKSALPCQAPERISKKVLVVSQIVNFDGKEILNMDLFYMGKLRGRYFADKEEKTHAAFADGKWYSCMINNVARVCKNLETIKGDGYYYGDDWEFASKEDKQTALGYLGTYSVTSFEVSANQVKYERAYQRNCKRIDEIMGKIPCVPDAMEKWVQQEFFPEQYLFIKKKDKNRTEYSCTACGWRGEPNTICRHGKSLKEALQLDGNRTNRLKQLNGGLYALEWLQYEEEAELSEKRIKISQESLEYLNTKKIHRSDCEEILKEVKSVNRMVNYMKKQKAAPNRLTQIWRDYLRMAKQEGMDTTDDIVRLPKDLKARHVQLVELRNARRDAERLEKEKKKYQALDERIRKHTLEVKRYYWEDDTYMIIPAGRCGELVTEGRTLHHCVGSSDFYMEKMADGKSWILFLRKKENLEKAYYTIEIRLEDDTILQYYSEFNRKPDQATISKVLNKYKRSIKRQQKPVKVRVDAIA